MSSSKKTTVRPRALIIPEGERNYITPYGMEKLKSEFTQLKSKERREVVATVAWAASNGDRSENADYQYGKRRLRQIDSRLEFLTKRLEAAVVIDPANILSDQVGFGATVTLLEEDGTEKTYTIVGVDELDLEKGWISWKSPLARAMLKAREGDVITFDTPKGQREVEIVNVSYVPLAVEAVLNNTVVTPNET
ncbi:MAG: transcription elongation factor GreB [Bdellovibrionales bacterium]|nr:transcription elongation factor GreB [Bdellovibrionales bacterium]